MCARYLLEISDAHVRAWLDLVETPEWAPPLDIRPTDRAPVILHSRRRQGLMATWMRFGLVPAWVRDGKPPSSMFNARSETAASKPAFREAAARRHAVVPASAFVEWSGVAGSRKAQRIDRGPSADPALLLAGLWESWTDPDADPEVAPLYSFTVLTREARGPVAQIHTRMPVLVPSAAVVPWLTREMDLATLVKQAESMDADLQFAPLGAE